MSFDHVDLVLGRIDLSTKTPAVPHSARSSRNLAANVGRARRLALAGDDEGRTTARALQGTRPKSSAVALLAHSLTSQWSRGSRGLSHRSVNAIVSTSGHCVWGRNDRQRLSLLEGRVTVEGGEGQGCA